MAKSLKQIMNVVNRKLKLPRALFIPTEKSKAVATFSTPFPSLDRALGVPGLPRGRIIEVFGPESGGKTTLCLQLIAHLQKTVPCALIDTEHAMDPVYARRLHVDLNNLAFSQPDSAEEALDTLVTFVKAGGMFAVLDSAAALVPAKELEGEMGDMQVGLQPRLISKAVRKLQPALKAGATVIFINQIRAKIGGYGNPETTPGGYSLRFGASVRMRIGGDRGEGAKIKIVKNKVGPPFKDCYLPLREGKGFDAVGDVVAVAEELDILTRKGATYVYDQNKLAGSHDKLLKYLRGHGDVLKSIRSNIGRELWQQDSTVSVKLSNSATKLIIR